MYIQKQIEGLIVYERFSVKSKCLVTFCRHFGPFFHPLFFIQNEQDVTKKDSHKYDSEWQFAPNVPLIYENKCPKYLLCRYPCVQMHLCTEIHTCSWISSLLQGTQSTDTLGQISQMLNLEKDQDQLFADL